MEKKDGFFERFFGISKNGSSMRIEILAGVTTFITIAYILILNPQILADPYMIMGDAVMAGKISNGVFIGTCIGAFIGTILWCALCKGSICAGARNGIECVFCLYSGTGNGLQLQ